MSDKLWSRLLMAVGIIVAVANMVLAWNMILDTPKPNQVVPELQKSKLAQKIMGMGNEYRRRSPINNGQAKRGVRGQKVARSGNSWSDEELAQLLSRMVSWAFASDRMDFREMVVILSLAFTLMAIGFALIVMGVENVVKIQAENRPLGSLMFATTSPGMLCVLLSGVIMAVTIWLRTGSPVNPKIEAQASLIQAQADAKNTAAGAQSELIGAKAGLVMAKADREASIETSKQSLIEAKAALVKARAAALHSNALPVESVTERH